MRKSCRQPVSSSSRGEDGAACEAAYSGSELAATLRKSVLQAPAAGRLLAYWM